MPLYALRRLELERVLTNEQSQHGPTPFEFVGCVGGDGGGEGRTGKDHFDGVAGFEASRGGSGV